MHVPARAAAAAAADAAAAAAVAAAADAAAPRDKPSPTPDGAAAGGAAVCPSEADAAAFAEDCERRLMASSSSAASAASSSLAASAGAAGSSGERLAEVAPAASGERRAGTERWTVILHKPEPQSKLGIILTSPLPGGPPLVKELRAGLIAATSGSGLRAGVMLLAVGGEACNGHEHATQLLRAACGEVALDVRAPDAHEVAAMPPPATTRSAAARRCGRARCPR